jgi:KDO2-lipid IV(A) lauroyltransferase
LRYPLARGLGRLAYRLHPSLRHVIVHNLTFLVGPERAKNMAPELLANFAMTSVDFFCFRNSPVQHLREENTDVLQKCMQASKKVIVVTAHLGSWEMGISYLARKGYPMTAVYATYREEKIVRWIMGHRDPSVQWVSNTTGAIDACVQALERGRVLGMVADLPFGEKGRRVRIANGHTHMPLGPWAIASRAGAAVIPGFVLRETPGQYRIQFYPPFLPAEGSFRHQMETLQDQYRDVLEKYLLKYPEQWGVLQPFWDSKAS